MLERARFICLFLLNRVVKTGAVRTREFYPNIKANFGTYQILMAHLKLVGSHTVSAMPRAEGRAVDEFTEALTHPQAVRDVTFCGTLSQTNKGNYRLRIFCKSLDEKPVCRFDSDGPAHTNPEEGASLPARQIQSPHFHGVGSDGILRAFRTAFLEDESNEHQVKTDHQFGINHFCQEAKISGPNGTAMPIQIIGTPSLLSIDDPLTGVNFQI